MTILCFGESLIDLLGDQDNPSRFTAQSGGAPANVAVGIAKLGGKSVFLGGFGNDVFAKQLQTELTDHGVHVIGAHHARNTALAIVNLDSNGERSFAFHRHHTADLALSSNAIEHAVKQSPKVVHYCSNTLTNEESRLWHQRVLSELPGFKSYDVNLRLNLWDSEAQAILTAKADLPHADLIKLSDDEQMALALSNEELLAMSDQQTVLVTAGAKPVTIYHQQQVAQVAPPATQAIDTTAGGDGFMSGVLCWIDQHGWPTTLADWQEAVTLGTQVGAITVTRYGSFAALPMRAELEELLL